MDKMIADDIRKVMGKGEKIAPVKSIKLKIRFQKAKSQALEKTKKHG